MLGIRHIFTNDNVRLNYLEGGAGRTLLFIPGWSQTAAMFRPLLEDLSRDHRVIAIDMRGHGESEKPEGGYRISRLAADLADVVNELDLEDVALVGHSMGCAVIWSYIELFGINRLSRLALIDQAPVVTAWPDWNEAEKKICGSLHAPESLFQAVTGLSGPYAGSLTKNYIRDSLFTKRCPEETLEWVLSENLKFPRHHAARLLVELSVHDWRDVIRKIMLPTIVFGGEASIFHPMSQEWIANQIPGAQVEIFAKEEGGGHFMWLENPEKFLRLLRVFLESTA